MIDEKQRKILKIVMAAILLISMYLVAREGAAYVNSDKVVTERGKKKFCVVIDAGHGGDHVRPK